MLESLRRDVRIGVRVLTKERSFCALAVVVLALGIAGVTTMFSVVNAVMLRGFSFPTADRLVSVNFIDPSTANFFGVNGQVSPLDFQEFEAHQRSYEALAAFLNGSTVNVTIDGRPQRYTGAYVTHAFLRALGTQPVLGRDFLPSDDTAGAAKVALIGYGVWQRDFGGAPDIVGRPVRINGSPGAIIGVMPRGFAFPTNEEIWLPLFSEYPPTRRGDPTVANPSVLGVLKAGVSLDQANAEATTVARRFAEAYPATNKHFNAGQVQRLLDTFTPRPLRGTLWTMLGFCVGVLLIACVNVMNMQFARATLRAKELAVRSSLGASRGRLVRQMLTESVLIAGIGALIGILLAYESIGWLAATLANLGQSAPPSWMVFVLDGKALVFTVAATAGAAILSGLLPAWMSSRANAVEVLRDGGRGNTNRAIGLMSRGLVVFQVVVTCVLLVGSLLQLRSLRNQETVDYGYDTSGVMSARMGLMEGAYPTPAARKQFYDRLLQQLQNDPEFAAVGLTSRFRMVFDGSAPIEIDGHVYREDRDRPPANFEQVAPGYFDVTSQTLLAGRGFTTQDGDDRQPVAIVNAAFAAKFFGRSSALGHRLRVVPNGAAPGPWRAIIGVVSTVRMLGPFTQTGLDDSGFYVPFYATPVGPLVAAPAPAQFATLVVRPRRGVPADTLGLTLRHLVNGIDPDLPLYFVGTPKTQIESFVAQNWIIATMFTVFGLIAVVLASVGIYGVMSFAVNQRRQEFGVRMALGARQGRILAMVLRQGAVQVALGLFLGMGLALTLATLGQSGIQGILFGVSARDPLTYASVAGLVVVVALTATLVPARRATRVDPMIALRAE
ncbi:MAG TPA: ABC transporter permease [Vicinamibacterales bacterium]|nr:ABC transporter permease [Vicinamibacterales bacterium]